MTASETLSVLTRYANAWKAGDIGALVAVYADDFTLHYGGANAWSGTHAGKDAALKALAAVTVATKRRLIEIVDVMAGAALGTLIVREAFTAPEGDVIVSRVLVYRVAEGLMRECWLYDSDQALVDRLIGA